MRRWDWIAEIINKYGCKRIAEIGVARGDTSSRILQKCSIDKYYLVDPKENAAVVELVKAYPDIAEYMLMTSEKAATFVSDSSLDLVYVDALHDYDNVSNDTFLWFPKLKPSRLPSFVSDEPSFIIYHDYENKRHRGVKPAVDDFFGHRIFTIPVKSCKLAVYFGGVEDERQAFGDWLRELGQ